MSSAGPLALVLVTLLSLSVIPDTGSAYFYRGRPGSSLALAKRLESSVADLGAGDDDLISLPASTLEALEWRSRFPPATADLSSFYPFFRQPSSALAKKNKDSSGTLEPDRGGNRKFQTQGWRR